MKKRTIIIIGICLLIGVGAITFFVTRKNNDTNNVIENVPEVVTENEDVENKEETETETLVVEGNNEVAEEVKPVTVTNKKTKVVKETKPVEVTVVDDDDDPQPQEEKKDDECPVLEGNENEIMGNMEMSSDDKDYIKRMRAELAKMYAHSTLPKVSISD